MKSEHMYTYNLGLRFKAAVAQCADAVALVSEAGSLTYRELDEQSDAFAHWLAEEGIANGDVISISGEKEPKAIVAILGALKIGVTYSVFDPESPAARLSKIFQRCKPALVFCRDTSIDTVRETGFKAVDFSSIDTSKCDESRRSEVRNRMSTVGAGTPAYIMFTSGSTGFPKGATMTHQNVLNLIDWSLTTYGFSRDDVLTSVNPLYFDNSVFDLYSSLFSGASLALFDAATVRNPGKLLKLIDQFKCTSWFSVPSMLMYLQSMRAFRKDTFKTIKRIIFGGEGYPRARLKELFDTYADRITFYNVYGPTECTCICSSYEVSAADFSDLQGFLPLGELIPNFDYIVVDEELRQVAEGETGELVLRGPNVGLGYFNDPERTQASFIQNPVQDAYPEKVYRTGDLVFVSREDGKIWIVGRADNQIKHMGYRIELEEIENALSCVESVKQCAVVHCEIRALSQIVAFVQTDRQSPDEGAIREALQALIPPYMIPTRFEFVRVLPTNANGKLDRKRLKSEFVEQSING